MSVRRKAERMYMLRKYRYWNILLLSLALTAGAIEPVPTAAQVSPLIIEYPMPAGTFVGRNITVGPDGNLWFTAADALEGRLCRSPLDGSITTFPSSGGRPPSWDVTAGPDGALWFTYFSNLGKGIGRMSTDGTVTDIFPGTTRGDPYQITSGPDGNLWFTEQTGNRIGRITPTGVITEFVASGFDIAAGPDGNLWYAAGTAIGRITPVGDVTLFPLPNQENAFWIAAGPDGNLWYTK